GDHDLAAGGADGHGVPFAGLLAGPARRGDDVIDRAGVLVEIEVGVAGMEIIEDLDFHAEPADPTLLRGADIDAAVATGGNAVFQAQLEIREVALGPQPAAAAP